MRTLAVPGMQDTRHVKTNSFNCLPQSHEIHVRERGLPPINLAAGTVSLEAVMKTVLLVHFSFGYNVPLSLDLIQ